jgi:acyl-CoA hydrolase
VGEEICSGFFFMVAIDESMKPVEIPQFEPKSDDEKEMWVLANNARNAMR